MPGDGVNPDRLDLRRIPTWERPALLLSAFERLPVSGSLVFVADYEPRPLAMRLEHVHPGAFAWVQRHVGHHEWEVSMMRVDRDDTGNTMLNYLQRTVFGTASQRSRDELAAAAVQHTARKGTVVYDENVMWPYLGFLREGMLSLSTCGPSGGRERVLYDVLPFEAFGVIQALDGGLTLGKMTVMSPKASYLLVPLEVVSRLIQSDPEVGSAIGTLCAARARELAHRLSAQGSQTTLARVAYVLLPYAAPEKGLQPALPPVEHLTQAQLAAAAGTVKEVAARSIAELETRGALRRERGRIRFLDRNKLLEFVN